jgi:outer membrane protein assembly factor BamB
MSHHRRQFIAAAGSTLAGPTGTIVTASQSDVSKTREDASANDGDQDRSTWIPGVSNHWSVPARRESPPVDPERNRVYVGHGGRVTAHDLDSGGRLWEATVGERYLTLAADSLFVFDARAAPPSITALDPADGSVRWSETVSNGLLSAPTVHDGGLHLETRAESGSIDHPIDDQRDTEAEEPEEVGRIEVRSPEDGQLQWQAEAEGQLRVESTADQTVVVRAIPSNWLRNEERLYGLDAETGIVRWKQVEDAPTTTWAPGQSVYCTHPSDGLLRARDPLDGTIDWERTGDVGPAVRAAHDGTVVFTTRSDVLAIEEATGSVRWEHEVGDRPQPADAIVDSDRELVYAATRDRPAYLAGGSANTESTTVIAWRLDTGEREWARTCPYYSSGRLSLGDDSVYVHSWRGPTLESGCTALDPTTGAIQFRSAIDGTRVATPPDVVDSPTLVVAHGDEDGPDDGPQLHTLTAGTAEQSRGGGAGTQAASIAVIETDITTIKHTDTIGIAATLEAENAVGATIRLQSADGSQSTTLTETAITEETETGRLQTASVERSTLSFVPAVCEIDAGGETLTVDLE